MTTLEIIRCVASGMSRRTIAKVCGIGITGVDYHINKGMRLLKLHSIAELTRWAIRVGLACVALAAMASVPIAPTSIVLAWDQSTNTPPDVFKLYCSSDISVPLNLWTNVVTVAGTNTTITNVMLPGKMFFYVTASNFWGESGPSNVTNTPVVPQSVTNLTIHK